MKTATSSPEVTLQYWWARPPWVGSLDRANGAVGTPAGLDTRPDPWTMNR